MNENRNPSWPILTEYDANHLARVAMPIGGIGTGTVSLGGRGNLLDWEIVNRPAKGFTPNIGSYNGPFFCLYARQAGGPPIMRLLEGPLPLDAYEASHGSNAQNHGLPRFRTCGFAAAYPLGQVMLQDDRVPVTARIEAFNPMVPADLRRSSIPAAVLRYVIRNTTSEPLTTAICGVIPNFVGQDGHSAGRDWIGRPDFSHGQCRNRNRYRQDGNLRGIEMWSEGVDPRAEQWGTMALTVLETGAALSHRTAWPKLSWGDSLLDFWDDLSANGELTERDGGDQDNPTASLAARMVIPPHDAACITFLLTWHFPNRRVWHPRQSAGPCCDSCEPELERVGNHYATIYRDAWDVAARTSRELPELERETVSFVKAFCASDLPDVVKEAALYNASTLRSQTSFRTQDGHFFGWEGSCDTSGCCFGSCTHVWNYEQTTPYLFGELATSMRQVEFEHATDRRGLMSFRVHLPLDRSQEHGRAAADGQMGCIMKLCRDWQLSGDEEMLRRLWPPARRALEFCWIEGGWDADQDGVMEGCQHNTMDVEYYGPNPQMGTWYLGALRAAEEMAAHLGDSAFAAKCHDLLARGSAWMDAHLFNGQYYEHEIRAPGGDAVIAEGLRVGMGGDDLDDPILQLGAGCLVDQLVGQYMAHVCGLGYLLDVDHVRRTLESILRHNYHHEFHDHFNHLRSFVLGDESGLLMASYPLGRRPKRPFPYYNEVMTGFEYCAAIHMLYEGMEAEGLQCIRSIRERYDGAKRSPFDEAECGHRYARAMAAWAAVLALTGFHYSAVTKALAVGPREGTFFWSNGYAWGTYALTLRDSGAAVELDCLGGSIGISALEIRGIGRLALPAPVVIDAHSTREWTIPRNWGANDVANQ